MSSRISVSEESVKELYGQLNAVHGKLIAASTKVTQVMKTEQWQDRQSVACAKAVIVMSNKIRMSAAVINDIMGRLKRLESSIREYIAKGGLGESQTPQAYCRPGLLQTNESYNEVTFPNGSKRMVYDHPFEIVDTLNYAQGNNSLGYGGTCSLVSVQNVLTMMGHNVSEDEVVKLASKHNLCGRDGGTNLQMTNIQSVLECFGVSSSVGSHYSTSDIIEAVEGGRGVIISGYANALSFQYRPNHWGIADHAVTITSVVRDNSGNATGFIICDSGQCNRDAGAFIIDMDTFNRFYTNSLEHHALITDIIIR